MGWIWGSDSSKTCQKSFFQALRLQCRNPSWCTKTLKKKIWLWIDLDCAEFSIYRSRVLDFPTRGGCLTTLRGAVQVAGVPCSHVSISSPLLCWCSCPAFCWTLFSIFVKTIFQPASFHRSVGNKQHWAPLPLGLHSMPCSHFSFGQRPSDSLKEDDARY